jgi:hypothetical protein
MLERVVRLVIRRLNCMSYKHIGNILVSSNDVKRNLERVASLFCVNILFIIFLQHQAQKLLL